MLCFVRNGAFIKVDAFILLTARILCQFLRDTIPTVSDCNSKDTDSI